MIKYSYHSAIFFPTEVLRETNRNQEYSAKIVTFLWTKFINKLCVPGLHFLPKIKKLKKIQVLRFLFCLHKITETQSPPRPPWSMPTFNIGLKSLLDPKAYGSSLQVAPGTIEEMNRFFFPGAQKYRFGWKMHVLWFWKGDMAIFNSQMECSQFKWPYYINKSYHSPSHSQQFQLFGGNLTVLGSAVPTYKWVVLSFFMGKSALWNWNAFFPWKTTYKWVSTSEVRP